MKITHTVENGIPTTYILIPSFDRPKNRYRHNDPPRTGAGSWLNPWQFKCRSHREKVYRKKMRYLIQRGAQFAEFRAQPENGSHENASKQS